MEIDDKLYNKALYYTHTKEEDLLEMRRLNFYDVMVKQKNGDVFIYDNFSNSYRYVYYESDDLTDEQYTHEFTRTLRERIMRSGWNQDDIAKAAGISPITLNRYVNGHRAPDYITLHRLAKALNCSVEDFYYQKY
ncbi:MAG: helix-turn-helix transcriptional regulator [Clostridia bacterium]|nr:helix-turn-helix transcriptional regulator [Clostridia bacterium]